MAGMTKGESVTRTVERQRHTLDKINVEAYFCSVKREGSPSLCRQGTTTILGDEQA
jgi:hypothetical protein